MIENRRKNFPSLIVDRIYIGNLQTAEDFEILQELNITHILIVASYLDPSFPNNFKYKIIEVNDLPNAKINTFFSETYDFIKTGLKDSGSVLIHW